MGRNRRYTEDFKQNAVNYYHSSGKTIVEAAQELKVPTNTLGDWINKAEDNGGTVPHRGSGNYSSDEAKEIARLKKELKDKSDALEILKKAIGILND